MLPLWFLLSLTVSTACAACEETFLVTCESLSDVQFNKTKSKWTELLVQPEKYFELPPPRHTLSTRNLDKSLSNLKWLFIISQVKLIERQAFINLENLQNLILYNNNIKTIFSRTFVHSDNRIEKISLKNNNILEVKDEAFYTANVKIIDLSHNKIKVFQTGWLKKSTVQELILTHNFVEALKIEDKVPLLHLLHLDHNQLNYLPAELTDLSQLEELSISHNRLYSLITLTKLSKLKKIDLSFNYLENLSDEFDSLRNLQYLDLSSNRLKRFTFTDSLIGNMKEKFDVFLAYNRLRNLNLQDIGNGTLVRITLAGNPWHCDCFDKLLNIFKFSEGNIINTICDQKLLNGGIPYCVKTDKEKCSNKYDLPEEQYYDFEKAAKNPSCDIFNDLDAKLS